MNNMKQKIFSLLVLLLTAATGAWAVSGWTGGTYNATAYEDLSAITVSEDATLTINAGVTVYVNGGITISEGKTLTVVGPGTLMVGGTNGDNGYSDGVDGFSGDDGGAAVRGTIVVQDGANVTATGGYGGSGGEGDSSSGNGGQGGAAFWGEVTIYGGTISALGGAGGDGGGADGGSGGYAFVGTLTYYGGNVTATGGNGGSGLYNDGDPGLAFFNGVNFVNAPTSLTDGQNGINQSAVTNYVRVNISGPDVDVNNPTGTAETIDVNPVAGQQNQWEFNMPASDVELTPIYAAATIYEADGETEKQAYETLKEAFAAVQHGDIIKLDWNVTLTEQLETSTIAGDHEFTLDLNGYIIDGNSGIYLNNAGDRLLFTDSSDGQTGGYMAGDLLGETGSVFAFDAGRYKFGENTAESLNDYCATPDSPWEMIDGKEFVDIDDADGFTLRVDYKTFELAIPAGKFATFCDNHNVALADGTDASVGLYTISSIDDERTTATATAISSAVVPGTMPMLVYNGSDADQTVKLKVSPDNVTGAQTWAGAFQGTATEHEFTATDMQANDYYALSGGQYFVPVLSAGTIAAHKCWLQFPKQQTSGSRKLTIVFEGNGTTGIADNKRESTTNNRYYDLNGRQLNAAPTQKGVYILNGKKVVVK